LKLDRNELDKRRALIRKKLDTHVMRRFALRKNA